MEMPFKIEKNNLLKKILILTVNCWEAARVGVTHDVLAM
jgi:phage terminase large subunit GpA-like protein